MAEISRHLISPRIIRVDHASLICGAGLGSEMTPSQHVEDGIFADFCHNSESHFIFLTTDRVEKLVSGL